MSPKIESYLDLLSMKDAGIKPKFIDLTDEQLIYFCIHEDLIDSEIAFLYNVSTDDVRNRRYQAYLNQLHTLQEKLLQDHFIVKSTNSDDKDISSIKSEKRKAAMLSPTTIATNGAIAFCKEIPADFMATNS